MIAKTKKTPSVIKTNGVSPNEQTPKVQGTLSSISPSPDDVKPTKNILDDRYLSGLIHSLKHYPPSTLAKFFAALINGVALQSWDDGRLYNYLVMELQTSQDRADDSNIIADIKRVLFLEPYVAPYTEGLRQSGKFMVGKCPFCKGKNKFWVSKNGLCNCFKCSFERPMDIVNFYCRLHDVDLDEAIHQLAKEAGLDK